MFCRSRTWLENFCMKSSMTWKLKKMKMKHEHSPTISSKKNLWKTFYNFQKLTMSISWNYFILFISFSCEIAPRYNEGDLWFSVYYLCDIVKCNFSSIWSLVISCINFLSLVKFDCKQSPAIKIRWVKEILKKIYDLFSIKRWVISK